MEEITKQQTVNSENTIKKNNMENDILKIEVAKQDLKETPEYWASESYETMIGKLQKLVEAKTGYPPFRNTKVIREVSFKITSRTTL